MQKSLGLTGVLIFPHQSFYYEGSMQYMTNMQNGHNFVHKNKSKINLRCDHARVCPLIFIDPQWSSLILNDPQWSSIILNDPQWSLTYAINMERFHIFLVLLVGFKTNTIVKIQLPEDCLTTNCLQNWPQKTYLEPHQSQICFCFQNCLIHNFQKTINCLVEPLPAIKHYL